MSICLKTIFLVWFLNGRASFTTFKFQQGTCHILASELIGKWRAQGIRCTGYIEDSLHAAATLAQATINRERVMRDFALAGFRLVFWST
jgi:hypothetical protein